MKFNCEYKSGKLITFIGVIHVSISEYSFIIKDDEGNTYYLKKENMENWELYKEVSDKNFGRIA